MSKSEIISDDSVDLTINGQAVSVEPGTSIWSAAKSLGIDIPVLCHSERLRPVGVCRLCVVDTGERTLPAACVRACENGMTVETHNERVETQRRMLLELLLSEQPQQSRREESTGDDDLLALAMQYGINAVELPDGARGAEAGGGPRGADNSSTVIAVDHQACILCDKCIRGCNELQHNDVITRHGKGYEARIAFDLDADMGDSSCVSCGECMAVCPTGALVNKSLLGLTLEVQNPDPEDRR